MLKTAEQVRRLVVSRDVDGQPQKLGSGEYGVSYFARIHWKDGTSHRVVVKRFKPDGYLVNVRSRVHGDGFSGPMTADESRRYQSTIADFRREGVRLPKMGVFTVSASVATENRGLLFPGEPVLVSSLFGSRVTGSKFYGDLIRVPHLDREVELDVVDQLVRMANADRLLARDSMRFFRTEPGKSNVRRNRFAIVADLDVSGLMPRSNRYVGSNSEFIADLIWKLAGRHSDSPSSIELINAALRRAKGPLKSAIRRRVVYLQRQDNVRDQLHFPHDAKSIAEMVHAYARAGHECTVPSLARSYQVDEETMRRNLDSVGAFGRAPKQWVRIRSSEHVGREVCVYFDRKTGRFRLMARPAR